MEVLFGDIKVSLPLTVHTFDSGRGVSYQNIDALWLPNFSIRIYKWTVELNVVCEGEPSVVLNTAFEKCPYFMKPAYVTDPHQNNWTFSRLFHVSANLWSCLSEMLQRHVPQTAGPTVRPPARHITHPAANSSTCALDLQLCECLVLKVPSRVLLKRVVIKSIHYYSSVCRRAGLCRSASLRGIFIRE